MQLMSVPEYARFKGVTPQAIYGKIKRGTLKTVTEKVEELRIVVEDTERDCVKA